MKDFWKETSEQKTKKINKKKIIISVIILILIIALVTISLIYVAAPVLLTTADLSKTLPIPPQLYEALLHYIGYRAHGALDGNIQAENSTHYQRFEASCQRAKESGMYTSDSMEMNRDMKGFV